MKLNHKIFVVSAPSGAGKTTLVNRVIQDLSSDINISRVITYTTKNPRPGEIHKVDYNFLTTKEFEQKIEEGYFLEWSKVYTNYYGSPKYILDDLANRSFILVVDLMGAQLLKKLLDPSSSFFIWIKVDSLETLRSRLLLRNSDSAQDIERRISIAKAEMAEMEENTLFDDYIYNVYFEEALSSFKSKILGEIKKK